MEYSLIITANTMLLMEITFTATLHGVSGKVTMSPEL